LTFILYKAVDLLLGNLSSLVRSGGGVLSGRDIIWEAVYEHALKFFNIFDWLLGWGHLGQMQSGVSEGYMGLFSHLKGIDPERMSVHSSFIQLMLDWGLFGLTIVLLISFKNLSIATDAIRQSRE